METESSRIQMQRCFHARLRPDSNNAPDVQVFALAKEVRENTGRTGQGFIESASNFEYSTDSCI